MKNALRATAYAGLFLVVISGFSAALGQDKPPRPEQIIERHVEASGGLAALEKIKTRVVTAKIDLSGNASGELKLQYGAPNKACLELTLDEGVIRRWTDGKSAWESSPAGTRELEGAEAGDLKRNSALMRWAAWKKFYKDAATIGSDKIGEEPCWKVRLTAEDRSEETCWFSSETGLLRRIERTRKNPMTQAEALITNTFEDYRRIDGVMIAHKTTVKTEQFTNVQTAERVEHNVELPAGLFDPPAKAEKEESPK